jgi:hypothetical protein
MWQIRLFLKISDYRVASSDCPFRECFFLPETRKPLPLLGFMETLRRGGKFQEVGAETDF